MESSSPLLAPLTAEQQCVVDLLAEAFLLEDFQWPFFGYVEAVLDNEGLNAIEVLQSFPEIGRWGYGAVS